MKTNIRILDSKIEKPMATPYEEVDCTTDEIFQRYNEVLLRYISHHIECQEDVPEIAQEVYLRLIKIKEKGPIRHPQAFLFKIARNLLRDRIRRKAARASNRHVSMDVMELVSPSPSPEEIIVSKEIMGIVEDTLKCLKPEAQQAFMLHRYKGLTYDKIALSMGISKRTVRHYISSALVKFRVALKGFI